MFKHYRDISDVVSVLVFCQSDRSYLLTKDPAGELWIPSSKAEKNCWKLTAQKLTFELFGADVMSQCVPLRIYKVWLPNHAMPCVYHATYKISVKADMKKRAKIKGMRNRVQWMNSIELERQRAHGTLKSPELAVFIALAMGEQLKESDVDIEGGSGMLVEICDDNVLVSADVAAGAASTTSPNYLLLQSANYSKEVGIFGLIILLIVWGVYLTHPGVRVIELPKASDMAHVTTTTSDQIRIYREFLLMVYPAIYMSTQSFTQFMQDLGWQRTQCPSLFRAADISGRGGLSFMEFLLWTASMEPATQHSGLPAEIRCRYIFRYFDSNRDLKLEYVEFKELVAAARAARQLPVDALSVARDADVCLRQLGLQPNSQLPLSDFLRGVGELRLRGTSSLLRAPRSIAGYLIDLQERDQDANQQTQPSPAQASLGSGTAVLSAGDESAQTVAGTKRNITRPDYNMALFTVHLRKQAQSELLELNTFDDDAVSPSTARLMPGAGPAKSLEVLGPATSPVEAITAVHYFAMAIEKTPGKRASLGAGNQSQSLVLTKAPWSWASPHEEASLGVLLLKLAEAVRPICAAEPRLLRLSSPVYAIGDLHGNLNALLAMEAALWPCGAALAAATILFLGDFVDRGPHGTELMAYLLAAKLQRPRGVLLVRGNHETRDIQKMFTFHTECMLKYGESEGVKIWNAINQVFDVLPLAAVVDDKVFCCHGGIPPPWVCPLISAIDKIPVPLSRPAEQSSIAWELLWNDPVKPNKITGTLALELTANEGFAANAKRGTGHVFDQGALDRFLLANQLSHVVRAHELHQNGFMCQLRGRLVSVFSSSHYCGGTNDSGVAMLEGGKLRLMRVNADY